jgi:glycopeptide antibiotics resistance protein
MNLNKEKFRYVGINLILFAILYFSVTFNKEYIRPVYGGTPFLGILTGSFSNFMAAFIISLFPLAPLIAKKTGVKKSSKVYDIYDIIASGLGSVLAILLFEIFLRVKANRGSQPASKV